MRPFLLEMMLLPPTMRFFSASSLDFCAIKKDRARTTSSRKSGDLW
jgi:hypothetical protein